jgi:hypothetical protein
VTNHDPLDTESQAKAKQDRENREVLAAKQEAADIEWLMGSKRGRRIVWGVLSRAGVFRLSFSTNSMQMAFNDGAKNEGLRMLALVNATCPEQYVQMSKEAKE